MKRGALVVGLAGFAVVAGIAYAFLREKTAPADPEPARTARPDASPMAIQVDDLARNPEDYRGEIVLRAVVAGVNGSEGVFGVIDAREFESCGELTCAENTLPVKFAGDLPEPRTVVAITGRLVREKRGLRDVSTILRHRIFEFSEQPPVSRSPLPAG